NTSTSNSYLCTGDLSADDCSACLQAAIKDIPSCCYASRGARVLSRSCYLRYELYAFYEGQTENSAPDPNKGKRTGSQRKILVTVSLSIVSASLAVVSLGICLCCFAKKVRNEREKKDAMNQGIELHGTADPINKYLPQNSDLTIRESAFIDFSTLCAATNNFSSSNFLGQGGFGPVYKGVLWTGKEIAIKRLSSCSEQGIEEFTNEVLLIIKLQHKNLVRLLGFCIDGEEKLLVYEFMPNSSLDVFLFDPRKRAQLSWGKRINIINGIAKGMLYLHEDSRLRIIHRDLKASNVLLDYDMNPKISDFGMARIFAGLEGEANTARIVGTYGCMAPEYAMEGLYSTKSDVFSFGVLLLEIMTGRRNAGFHRSKRAPSLLAYAWQLWNEGNVAELIDPTLTDSCRPDEFSLYIHIGLLCVQQDANDRPTMSSVAVMLRSETSTLSQPQRPPFSVGRFGADDNSCSVNGVTTSDAFPR
ncbi:cysteine-rich receptor-like protein kinase 10, partial [Tripterygium wilfordii]|uniref:cysteine-rich receptor-like protein kinase 10 n=1 Tax=Tripterygium wilfordii TaxID=458696 RepID=UPI0018F7F8B2